MRSAGPQRRKKKKKRRGGESWVRVANELQIAAAWRERTLNCSGRVQSPSVFLKSAHDDARAERAEEGRIVRRVRRPRMWVRWAGGVGDPRVGQITPRDIDLVVTSEVTPAPLSWALDRPPHPRHGDFNARFYWCSLVHVHSTSIIGQPSFNKYNYQHFYLFKASQTHNIFLYRTHYCILIFLCAILPTISLLLIKDLLKTTWTKHFFILDHRSI